MRELTHQEIDFVAGSAGPGDPAMGLGGIVMGVGVQVMQAPVPQAKLAGGLIFASGAALAGGGALVNSAAAGGGGGGAILPLPLPPPVIPVPVPCIFESATSISTLTCFGL